MGLYSWCLGPGGTVTIGTAVAATLGLLHNLGDGCRGQNRGSATVAEW